MTDPHDLDRQLVAIRQCLADLILVIDVLLNLRVQTAPVNDFTRVRPTRGE